MTITRLAIVAVLGALAVFLGTMVVTLQVLILQRKQRLGIKVISKTEETGTDQYRSNTVTPSNPTEDIFLWKHVVPDGTSNRFAAQAYWNQVKSYLVELGDFVGGGKETVSSKPLPPHSHIHASLLEAARLGHADAQHYVAAAQASGVWLTVAGNDENKTIPEDFIHVSPETTLLWHMSAIEGNTEAMLALGHRIQASEGECSAYLPYYEAASNSIMDHLETDPNSRAKVSPPMDKHSLPQVHIHGGTSSQLNWDNKPDESPEALQYYHLLSVKQPDPDVHAAYTLAHLYHHGLRGVPQNLTQALYYYEIAANHNHWESAGQAGKFYLWSMGMDPSERNVFRAHKLFTKGAPLGLDGCRERTRQALKLKTKGQSIEETNVDICDHPSLNGLGLLYMYGVPMILAVDIEKARSYFQLAKDMGNMDAAYNLAMLKLGFRNGWKDIHDDNGESTAETSPDFLQRPQSLPSKEDWLSAIQELQFAANKGHIQARHRLGLIYSHGVNLAGTQVVPKDCKKAYNHFSWIVNNNSHELSERTRMAYRQYTAGDYEGALVNYLLASETGHKLSQVNAAFLLERGVCLHLTSSQCRAASLRLWKAAAQGGDPEAALRVGDFYYYGSKRQRTWLDIILYPEVHLPPLVMKYYGVAKDYLEKRFGSDQATTDVCEFSDDSQVCSTSASSAEGEFSDVDLEKAAHYYRMASQAFKSSRANFNLGYMHQWGLGLAQDFPLAKRHYDLAKMSSNQAALAVEVALVSMNLHEHFLKLETAWKEWNNPRPKKQVPRPLAANSGGEPVNLPVSEQVTKLDLILKHVVSWESLLIVVLTIILSRILRYRR